MSNNAITGTIGLIEQRLVGSFRTSERTAVNVITGMYEGRNWLRLQGMKQEGAGWTYHGLEILVPLDQAGELARIIAEAGTPSG